MPNQAQRIAIVVNPQTLQRETAAAWEYASKRLRREARVCFEMQTRGDGGDVERLVDSIREYAPNVVVAAGGDGTVSEVVRALVAAPAPSALAILPLGTANNVARSLGLASLQREGNAAADRAVAAVVGGHEKRIDLAEADGRPFIGSLAVGMDADILRLRNRLRLRFGLGRKVGGYPLYLSSCAVNVLRPHGGTAILTADGCVRRARFYNLLITNVPIYAGEFRFAADDFPDDGCLDLHFFRGAIDYLRRYPAAWRRHVRYVRGLHVDEPERERIRSITIESDVPLSAQLDGEEMEAATPLAVRVLPAALVVKVPVPPER